MIDRIAQDILANGVVFDDGHMFNAAETWKSSKYDGFVVKDAECYTIIKSRNYLMVIDFDVNDGSIVDVVHVDDNMRIIKRFSI